MDEDTITRTLDVLEGRAPLDERLRGELEMLVRHHYSRIVSVCMRITGDRETSQELAQDAIFTALRKLPEFEGRSNMSTWVCGIAKHLALNRVRKAGELLHEDGVVDDTDRGLTALRNLTRHERNTVVRQASLAVLDELEQDIVHARYEQNLKYATIADLLELPGGANEVRSSLQRIKRKLKPALSKRLEELGHGMSFVRTEDPPE